MSIAGACEECEGTPFWRLLRRGDAVVSWACGPHLAAVASNLQRHQSVEVTELVVTYIPTQRQHAEIDRAFGIIEDEFAPGGQ